MPIKLFLTFKTCPGSKYKFTNRNSMTGGTSNDSWDVRTGRDVGRSVNIKEIPNVNNEWVKEISASTAAINPKASDV